MEVCSNECFVNVMGKQVNYVAVLARPPSSYTLGTCLTCHGSCSFSCHLILFHYTGVKYAQYKTNLEKLTMLLFLLCSEPTKHAENDRTCSVENEYWCS